MIKIVVILIILAVLLYLKSYSDFNNKPQKCREIILGEGNGKKALLLYHGSKHKTTEEAASTIGKELVALGYRVTINTPCKELNYDPMDFDLLIFGSPAYLGRPSQALIEYLKDNLFVQKKVLIFVTGLTPEDTREIEEIKEAIPKGNDVQGIKVYKNSDDKLKSFIRKSIK